MDEKMAKLTSENEATKESLFDVQRQSTLSPVVLRKTSDRSHRVSDIEERLTLIERPPNNDVDKLKDKNKELIRALEVKSQEMLSMNAMLMQQRLV